MNDLQGQLKDFEWFCHMEYLIFNSSFELVDESNSLERASLWAFTGHIIVTFDEQGKPHRLFAPN